MASTINSTDTGAGGLITTGDSSDELQLQTAETARVTLTNTAVVVNEDGNDVDFRVEGDTDANLLFVDAGTDRVGVGTNAFSSSSKMQVNVSTTTPSSGSPTSNSTFSIRGGTTTVGDGPILELANVSGAKETVWKISAVTVSGNNGDLAFHGYAGGATFPERVRFLSAGGITFNGDTAAANALDDYEEGTWTPVANGWTGITYQQQNGNYTKIGNQVTAWFYIQFSGTSAATNVTITGLPFTVGSVGHGGAMTYYDVPIDSTVGVLAYPTGTNIVLYEDSDAGDIAQSNGNASNDFLIGSVTYRV